MPERFRHRLPAVPVLLIETILDGVNRELVDKRLPMLDEIIRRKFLAGLRLMIEAFALLAVLPLRRGRIHCENEIRTGLVASILDRLEDMLDRIFIGVQIRSKSALVADRRRLSFLLEERLQSVKHLRRPAQRLTERGSPRRHNHELLRIHGVRCVRAAVEDVHHRHGQNVCLKAAEEAIERDILRLRRRIRCRNRNSKDRIRTELGLVLRAVQIEHRLIDRVDIACLEARKRRSDLFIYILDSLGNSFAAEFRLVAVTQLECFELPRRCPLK